MLIYEFLKNGKVTSKKDITAINSLLKELTANPIKINSPILSKIRKSSQMLVVRDSEYNNTIVAMATIVSITIPTGLSARIEDVVVDTKYRRKGIGKTLIKMLISEAKKQGRKHIDLTSNPRRVEANLMYKKLGFLPVPTNVYRLNF